MCCTEKDISEERMARRLAIGRKYPVRQDKSVSGDLQKLKGRLTAAKAEISSIKAGVVSVTSPAKHTPAGPPPRATAAPPPPKPKQLQLHPTKPLPHRLPVYSLRQEPPVRKPVDKKSSGPGGKERKTGAETRRLVTKPELPKDDTRLKRQKSSAEKTQVTSRTARLAQPKKPVNKPAHPQQQQGRVPLAKTSPKMPVIRRPAAPQANPDAAPRRPAVKKDQAKDKSSFPSDVDEEYTMKKFMEQRDSLTTVLTLSDKASVGATDRFVSNLANILTLAGADDLVQEYTDLTIDKVLCDKSGVGVICSKPPQTTAKLLDLKVTVDEPKQHDHIGNEDTKIKDNASHAGHCSGMSAQLEQPDKEQLDVVSVAVSKEDKLQIAVNAANQLEDKSVSVRSRDLEDSVISDTKTENATEVLSEAKSEKACESKISEGAMSIQNSDNHENDSAEIGLGELQKDTFRHEVHHDDAKKEEKKAEAEMERVLEREEDRLSSASASLYDDRRTSEDEDEYSEVAIRDVSSTEVAPSPLSDKDPELAALSATSTVSERDRASPGTLSSSSSGVVDTGNGKGTPKFAGEMVKVVDKDSRQQIVVDVRETERERQTESQAAQSEDAVGTTREGPPSARVASSPSVKSGHNIPSSNIDGFNTDYSLDEGPLRDNEDDEEERSWSGSDLEYEYELMRLKSASFEQETLKVDPAIQVGNSVDYDDNNLAVKTGYQVRTSPALKNKELKREAEEKNVSASDEDGDERHRSDITSREVTKVLTEDAVAEDDSGSIADEQVTSDTVKRELINAEPDTTDDDEFYGIPVLTPLDVDEGPDQALRGEGPSVYQDEHPARFYPLGEDGLPDFAAAYSRGLDHRMEDRYDGGKLSATEKSAANDHGQLFHEPEHSSVSGMQRTRDEVSSPFYESAQSDDSDEDAAYPPSSETHLLQSDLPEAMSAHAENRQQSKRISMKSEARPTDEVEIAVYAVPGSPDYNTPIYDHLQDTA